MTEQEIISEMGWDWYNTESSARRVAEYCSRNMYSEEEAYSLVLKAIEDCYDEQLEYHYAGDYRNLKEWFKQNKK